MSYDDYKLPSENVDDLPTPRDEDFNKTYIVKRSAKGNSLGLPAMVRLDDAEWTKYETLIGEMIEKSLNDRQGLVNKLKEYEETIQGIPEKDRKGPWPNSCKLRDQLTAAHCRIIESTINRTLGIERPFIATVKGTKDNKAAERKLSAISNEASAQFGFTSILGIVSKAATRAGTAIIIPDWERKVKVSKDVKTYYDLKTYKSEYPNAESSGLSKAEYKSQIEAVKNDIDTQGFHECLYEFDERVINRPKVLVIRPEKFVMYPLTSPDIELAQMVGYEIKVTYSDLVMMERSGRIKNAKKAAMSASSMEDTSLDEARQVKLENKGISDSDTSLSLLSKIFTLYKLIVRLDIYNDGIARDYECLYLYDNDGLARHMLRLAPYALHCNERNIIVANILPEEDTVFGTTIPELLENPQKTLDAMLRLLIDSNSIANVPLFKGHMADKEFIENSPDKGRAYPGRTYWLKQPQVFEAFKADRIDANAFLSMMQHISMQSEANSGGARSLAGQNMPDDPEAPGVKTSMLIQQSNFMINEYIKNLRPALAKMIKLVIKLYRQYMADKEEMVVTVENSNNQYTEMTVTRDDMAFLEEMVNFDVKNQVVEDSDAVRMAQARFDMEMLLAIPMIAQNPPAVRAILLSYLNSNPRMTQNEIDQIVPPMEQIQAQMQDVAKSVLEQEQAAQANQQVVDQANMQADQQTDQTKAELEGQMQELGGMINEANGSQSGNAGTPNGA